MRNPKKFEVLPSPFGFDRIVPVVPLWPGECNGSYLEPLWGRQVAAYTPKATYASYLRTLLLQSIPGRAFGTTVLKWEVYGALENKGPPGLIGSVRVYRLPIWECLIAHNYGAPTVTKPTGNVKADLQRFSCLWANSSSTCQTLAFEL